MRTSKNHSIGQELFPLCIYIQTAYGHRGRYYMESFNLASFFKKRLSLFNATTGRIEKKINIYHYVIQFLFLNKIIASQQFILNLFRNKFAAIQPGLLSIQTNICSQQPIFFRYENDFQYQHQIYPSIIYNSTMIYTIFSTFFLHLFITQYVSVLWTLND